MLEIGLVITSVTLLTRSRVYWYLGIVFSLARDCVGGFGAVSQVGHAIDLRYFAGICSTGWRLPFALTCAVVSRNTATTIAAMPANSAASGRS